MDDKMICKGIIEKNEYIFSQFVNQYINLFYKIARVTLLPVASESDIDDCISDSLIYIWFHMYQYCPEKYSLRNWCSMIVHNRAQNKLTSLYSQQRKIDRLIQHIDNKDDNYHNSPESIYMSQISEAQILKYVKELKPPADEIFIRRYLYCEPPRSISQKLNLSIKQVNNYLFRSKKILKKVMKADEN